jgi:hypothetical protein
VRCGVGYVTAFMAMDSTDGRASALLISWDGKSTNNAGMNSHVSLAASVHGISIITVAIIRQIIRAFGNANEGPFG